MEQGTHNTLKGSLKGTYDLRKPRPALRGGARRYFGKPKFMELPVV